VERIAVVTGAGSGIGRAVSRALSAEGWAVALAGRRRATLEETAAEAPRRTLVLPTDVTDPQAVAALFGRVSGEWGRLDLLFNNAGLSGPRVPFDEIATEDWREVVDTNLTGMFLCAREAWRIMKAQQPRGGRIVNNGSISAQAPRPDSAPYTATKHAVTGLSRSLQLDGRRHDIACCQIDIGNAATPMTARMPEGTPQADGRIASEPLRDVEHVARAVVYVAGLPLGANVPFMTVMATSMPLVGRG
jgi:NAD(P)-dependent dehydrogenase (short-subunit alcohol dehydrogenase family)